MSIDLDSRLVETATKVATTHNADGDLTYGTTSTSICLYRDISLQTQSANIEGTIIDGLLWFTGTENVVRGDIYNHSVEGYLKIIKITRAKRLLADNSQQFIKCEVARHRQIS